MVEVGTVVKAKVNTGVCYKVYELAEGGHDGFVDDELYILEILDVVMSSIADYKFTNGLTLVCDF
jgi:hypothetical protein